MKNTAESHFMFKMLINRLDYMSTLIQSNHLIKLYYTTPLVDAIDI
jgi:hypothetical protein